MLVFLFIFLQKNVFFTFIPSSLSPMQPWTLRLTSMASSIAMVYLAEREKVVEIREYKYKEKYSSKNV